MLEHALRYASLGWPVFRLSRSKKPLKGSHGFKDATTDPEIIRAWFRETPWANLGLATGDIVVLDADGPGGLEELRRMAQPHGGMPRTQVARTARGLHFYYRSPAGVHLRSFNAPRSSQGADGVDIKAHGGFVVLPPSVIEKTGFVYSWAKSEPIMELPAWCVDDIEILRGSRGAAGTVFAGGKSPPAYLSTLPKRGLALRVITPNAVPWNSHDEARVRSALSAIPAVNRDDWLHGGMALHSTHWANAFAIWDEWSRTSPEKYDELDQQATWKSFDRHRSGPSKTIGTIFRLAKAHGWTAADPPSEKIQNQSDGGANSTRNSDESETHSAADDGDGKAAPNGEESETRSATDVDNEIRRLAKLSMIDYERERKDAAQRLNLRASILDRLVAAERGKFEDDGKQGSILSLPEPEPWSEQVDGAELLCELSAVIRWHVVMSDHAADITALWSVHTYLLDCFHISPRLAVTSPEKGCGKTTALDVLLRLIFRPLPTANASASAIFRVVESHRPTLLIDEADTFLSENEELRGILNSGHRRGGSVIRTVGEDFEPRSFSTYSACAIALIGRLPATLADRSVPIELRRRRADEPVEPFRFDRTEHLDQLARKAARWALDNADRIRKADPKIPAGVFNRAADNWRPVLAIADAAGGEWPARARQAVQSTGASATGDDQSIRVLLLTDIRVIFAERGLERLSSAELVTALIAIEGRPWAEWKAGRSITANGLARLLAPFGIKPSTIRTGDLTPKGYQRMQFDDAFARYLPEQEF